MHYARDLEIGISLAKSPLGISSILSLIGRGSGVLGSVIDWLSLVPAWWTDMVEIDEEYLDSATRVNYLENTQHS
jgi:hypothetical protein